MRNVVWCLPAMRYFGELAAETLGYELMVGGPIGDCDLAYIVGMYDAPTYAHTLSCTARAKRRIIHWCGTDVLILQDASVLPEATHFADSEGLVNELAAKGVYAKHVMWPTRRHFEVTPLPAKPKVSCYFGSDPTRYGSDMMQAVEAAMPDIEFHGYMFGTYDEEHLKELVADTSIYIRLTTHDGSAASAREFMEAGRRAITTNGIPYATRVNPHDLTSIVAAIRKLSKETEPDYDAAAYWRYENAVERYLEEVADGCS